jgi:hypothetical protein
MKRAVNEYINATPQNHPFSSIKYGCGHPIVLNSSLTVDIYIKELFNTILSY